MNIAQMMVGMGVDPGGVTKGLNEATRKFAGFRRDLSSAFNTKDLISASAIQKQGSSAAKSLLDALTSTYQAEAGKARDALVAGVISPEEFAQAGAKAATAYNDGLRGGLQDLRDVGLATSAISGTISDSFKATGASAANTFWAAAAAGLVARRALPPLINPQLLAAQGTTGARALLGAFADGVRSGRGEVQGLLGQGLVDGPRLLASGRQGGAALVQGVRTGVVQTAGAGGLIPPTVMVGVAGEFGNAGRRGGAAAAEGFADEIRRRRGKIEGAIRETGQLLSSLGTGLSIGVTAPLVGGAIAAVKFASSFEDSMAEVRKTTDLSEKELAGLAATLTELSEQKGFGAADDLAKLAATGGQLGVANDQLDEFAATVKKLDIATNLSADEAATQLAQLQNITRGLPGDFERMGSAIVAVGNKSAATERDITAMAVRFAGAGTAAGLSQADLVGFAGTLASVGVEAEAGGTALSKVMLDIASAVASGGKALDNFAKLAGTSAAALRRNFEKDAAKAISSVILGLQRLETAGDKIRTLEAIGFVDVRQIRALLSMAEAGDLLTRSLTLSREEFEKNTALSTEFEGFANTSSQALVQFAQEARNTAREFGIGLLPVLKDGLNILRNFLGPVRAVAKAFTELPVGVRATIVALLGVAAAAGPVLLLMGKIAQSIVFLRAVSFLAAGAGGLGALAGILTVGAPLLVGLAAGAAALYLFGKSARDTAADVATFRAELAGSTQAELINVGASIQKQIDDLTATRDQLTRASAGFAADATAVAGFGKALNPGEIAARIKIVDAQLLQLQARQDAAIDLFNEQARSEAKAADEMERFAAQAKLAFGDLGLDLSKPKTELQTFAGVANNAIANLAALQAQAEGLATGTLGGDPLELKINLANALSQMQGLGQKVADRLQADLARGLTPPKELSELQSKIQEAFASFEKQVPGLAAALGKATAQASGLLGEAQERFARIIGAQLEVQFTATLNPGTFAEDATALARRVAKQLHQDPASRVTLDAKIDADMTKLADSMDKDLLPATKAFHAMLKKAGIEFNTMEEQAKKLAADLDQIGTVESAVKDFASIANEMGLINDETEDAIANIADLGAGIARIAAGDVLGGLVQGLSGLAGLAGIGESAEEKEKKRIDKENTAALLILAREIGNISLDITGDVFSKLLDVFGTVTGGQFLLKDNTHLGNRVSGLLAANGLSMDDVKDAAAQLGLTFQNTAQFYRDFAAALNEVELTTFTDTFTGQLDLLQRSFDVFNVTDPAEKLRQTLALLADPEVGSPALAQAFEGVDLTTAAGLEDLQSRLQDLFTNFGELTAEDLGGLTPSQFLDELAAAAGLSREALEALTGKTNDAVDAIGSMTNVPAGFKRAAAEWAATLPEVGLRPVEGFPLANVELRGDAGFVTELGKLADTLALQDLETVGALSPLPSMLTALETLQSSTAPDLLSALAEIRDAVRKGGDTVTREAPTAGLRPNQVIVNVHAAPNQSAREIGDVVVREFQRLGVRHAGDSLSYVPGG